MSKKIIYTLCAVSLGLNLGMIGMTVMNRAASPGPPPRGPDPGPSPGNPPAPERIIEDHVASITRHLGLDEVQSQAIREIMGKHIPSLIRLREQADSVSSGLSDVFAAPDFDRNLFLQRTAEASRARARVDSVSALILTEEAAVLTPDQRKVFAEVAPTIHSQPQGPRGRGGPPGREGPPPRNSPPPR